QRHCPHLEDQLGAADRRLAPEAGGDGHQLLARRILARGLECNGTDLAHARTSWAWCLRDSRRPPRIRPCRDLRVASLTPPPRFSLLGRLDRSLARALVVGLGLGLAVEQLAGLGRGLALALGLGLGGLGLARARLLARGLGLAGGGLLLALARLRLGLGLDRGLELGLGLGRGFGARLGSRLGRLATIVVIELATTPKLADRRRPLAGRQ